MLARVPVLEIRTLGPFAVRWAGGAVAPDVWDDRRASHVFQMIVAAPEHRIAHEELSVALWPESAPENARMNLAGRIAELRSTFRALDARPSDDFPLVVGGGFVSLDPSLDIRLDVRDLETKLREFLETESSETETAGPGLIALSAYTGQYLPLLETGRVLAERRRIGRGRTAVVRRLLQACGSDAAVRSAARAVLKDHPHDEVLAATLIDASLRADERERAFEAFELHAKALRLRGLEPAAELRLRVAPFRRASNPADESEAEGLRGRETLLAALRVSIEPLANPGIVELCGIRGAGRSRVLSTLVELARARGAAVGLARATLVDASDIVLHDLLRSLTGHLRVSELQRKRLVSPGSIVRFGDVEASLGVVVSAARFASAKQPVVLCLDDADLLQDGVVRELTDALAGDPAFPIAFVIVRCRGQEPLVASAVQLTVSALGFEAERQLLIDRFGADLDAETLAGVVRLWPGSLTRQRALAAEIARTGTEPGEARVAPAELRVEVEAAFAELSPSARGVIDGRSASTPADVAECDRAGLLGEEDGRPVVPPAVRQILGRS